MRASLPVALALAAAACGRQAQAPDAQPSEAAADAVAEATPTRKPALPAQPIEDGDEVQLTSLVGIWRVAGVVPGKSAEFVADDPRIVGALMDVFPDKLSWSYHPDKAFAPRDLCLGPVSGIIADPAIAGEVRAELAAARFGGNRMSRPHQWLCGDGGSWGEDAEFQTIGEDRMALRWPGDLTLVLACVRRASFDLPLF